MSNVQLRHHDYVLQIPSLPAGASILQAPLQLDLDSEFILRGRAVRIQSPVVEETGLPLAGLDGQADLVNYFDRYTGPDSGQYLSQRTLRFANECPTFGQFGSPLPVRPGVRYPRGGVIMVDVQNAGNVDYTNLELYFRGSKVFAPGVLPCDTYPVNAALLPQIFMGSSFVNQLRVNYIPLAQQERRLLNQIPVVRSGSINSDADFVIRSITGGAIDLDNSLAVYSNLYIQLRDENNKAYSNLPVHVDTCFGAFGSINQPRVPYATVGPYHPGLLTPEIYLNANKFLYFDLLRQDNYIGGAGHLASVNVQIAFNGSKVFHR